MRREFVYCKTKKEARELCPWAAVIIKAESGYWCFESVDDARRWSNQK